MTAWSAAQNGVHITLRLTPKGGRDSIDGIEAMSDGRSVLKARVRAAPHEGVANEALARYSRSRSASRGGASRSWAGPHPASSVCTWWETRLCSRRNWRNWRLRAKDTL